MTEPAPHTSRLSPISFLERSATVWAQRPAVRYRDRQWTYAEHHERVRSAAGALRAQLEIRIGDRVATLLPNIPAMLELHYAVPGTGGILVPMNTRLAADEYAYILEHSGASAVVAYRPLAHVLDAAVAQLGDTAPRVIWVEDGAGESCAYEALLRDAAPAPL